MSVMSDLSAGLYLKLDERLDTANAKIASLEGQLRAAKKKSWWQTASPWTALVAFLISLSSAGFTWYDRFWVGPAEDARATMDKLSAIQATLSEAMLNGPQEFQVAMASLNPQRIGLLLRAFDHYQARPHLFSGADKLMIGNELILVGEVEAGIEVADDLIAIPDHDRSQVYGKIMKANALRGLTALQDLGEARSLLSAAYQQVLVTDEPGVVWMLTDVQVARTLVEVQDAECDAAQTAVEDLASGFAQFKLPQMHRDTARQNLEDAVASTSDLCALDLSSL